MSGYDVTVIVAKVLTIIATILMRISLLPDFHRMRKLHSTGDKSIVPCVILYTHCFVATFYGYVIDDIVPLFATSVLGFVVGVYIAFFFYRWTDDKSSVLRIIAVSFVVCLVVMVYTVLALAGVTGQSNDAIGTTLGFVTSVTTTGLYVSPMATIARVLRTKTSSSMPFTMGVVNVFSAVSWIMYSSLVYNIFLLAPNSIGFVVGSIQLILTFIYPRKSTPDEEADRVNLSVLSVSHDQKTDEVKEESDNSFVALQSPIISCAARTLLSLDEHYERKRYNHFNFQDRHYRHDYHDADLVVTGFPAGAEDEEHRRHVRAALYAVDNIIPLFLTAALGVISGVILAFFFYKWTAHKRDVMKIFLISGVIMLLETIYGLVALLGWTGQTRSATGTTLGVLVIISSVGLYASPMATIRLVIRTKTSSSMPFTMGVINVVNSFCWVVYAILVDDVFILIPNASGALLGSIQLILTFIYPRKAPSQGQIGPINDQASLSVVLHSPSQDTRENRKSNGSSFVTIRSPIE